MGVAVSLSWPAARAVGISLLLLLVGGCSMGPSFSTKRLLAHQALIDFTDLASPELDAPVKAVWAPPSSWEQLPLQRAPLYVHRQWRSPSGVTGVGVAHIRLPLPLAAQTVARFAQRQYTQRDSDGRLLYEWTDDVGRVWFEAENGRYRGRGYVMTRGFDAWIIYFGYQLAHPPNPAELSLAARSMETILPQ